LEKVSILINKINYETYQQQLVEGVAQLVGQSVEQVRLVINHQEKTSQNKPYKEHNYSESPDKNYLSDFIGEDVSLSKTDKRNTTKTLMSKLISLLLNYPLIVDATAEVRVRNINNSEVLLELIHSAQIDESISQESLIKPFKKKTNIYSRLKELCSLEPHLSENQARDEFLECLNSIERLQKNTQIKHSIASASTIEEERIIMDDIKKGKRIN